MREGGVRVLNVLGIDYPVRAPAGEEAALEQAAARLQEQLDQNHRRFPRAGSHELLVLTALNLCVPLLEQEARLREVEARLAATVERIRGQLQG
ncbi:cell division protein ZapA [Pseudomonas stutzeri]|nr:cell division protein ZapA [Stutzerimonas stutzeri]